MIIKIQQNENGSHSNQSSNPKIIPNGWAVVPDYLTIPNSFPFVDIILDGQTVVELIEKTVPTPEPIIPEPNPDDDRDELLVDLEYRVTMLELGL